jgi:hypothetical protein
VSRKYKYSADVRKYSNVSSKANVWEVFDAGIASQTFCLAGK